MRLLRLALLGSIALAPATAWAQAAAPAVDALIADLDVAADPLHADITPAVMALCARGLPAAARVVDLLDAEDPMTRLHAIRVIECAVSRHHGFVPGRGFADDPAGEGRARAIFEANGSYDWQMPRAARQASMARWRAWLAAHATDARLLPERMSTRSLREALSAARPSMQACSSPGSAPAIRITFAGSGRVVDVGLPRELAGTAVGRCLDRAVRTIEVAPFRRRRQTVSVRVGR